MVETTPPDNQRGPIPLDLREKINCLIEQSYPRLFTTKISLREFWGDLENPQEGSNDNRALCFVLTQLRINSNTYGISDFHSGLIDSILNTTSILLGDLRKQEVDGKNTLEIRQEILSRFTSGVDILRALTCTVPQLTDDGVNLTPKGGFVRETIRFIRSRFLAINDSKGDLNEWAEDCIRAKGDEKLLMEIGRIHTSAVLKFQADYESLATYVQNSFPNTWKKISDIHLNICEGLVSLVKCFKEIRSKIDELLSTVEGLIRQLKMMCQSILTLEDLN
jgi:hypothetical protein